MAAAQVFAGAMAWIEDTLVTDPPIKGRVKDCDSQPPQSLESSDRLPILPREVLQQIVIHAVTAKNQVLYVRCLKPMITKNCWVNTACLVLE